MNERIDAINNRAEAHLKANARLRDAAGKSITIIALLSMFAIAVSVGMENQHRADLYHQEDSVRVVSR